MRIRFNIVAAVILMTTIAIVGCARKEAIVAKPRPMNADEQRVVESLHERTEAMKTMRASGRLEVSHDKTVTTTDVAVVLELPDRFRADSMDSLADVSASVGTKKGYIWVWLPHKDKLYRRKATRSNLRRFAHIDSKLEDFLYMLLGSVMVSRDDYLERFDGRDARYLMRLKGIEVWMDMNRKVPYRIIRYRQPPHGGGVLYEASFDDYRKVGAVLIPHRIIMNFPAKGSRAVIQYKSVQLNNEISPDIFDPPVL